MPLADKENVMKKLFALVLALLLTAACFAGCAKDKNSVVVGYTIYAPMNYFDENNELIGFDTELAQTVFKNLGYDNVVFQEIVWENKYTDLNSGAIDCIWNGFTANSADEDGVLRAEKVSFSYNYMVNQQAIVVAKDSQITSFADLNGKFGAAEQGSAGESYAKSMDGVSVKGFLKQVDCLLEVKAGTVDFAVVDILLAKDYCGKGDYANLLYLEELSSDVEYYAIGFQKGSDLTAKVNEQLEALAKDGTIAKLAEKYNLSNSAIKDFSDQK